MFRYRRRGRAESASIAATVAEAARAFAGPVSMAMMSTLPTDPRAVLQPRTACASRRESAVRHIMYSMRDGTDQEDSHSASALVGIQKNVGIGNTYPPGETKGQGKEVKLAPHEFGFRLVSIQCKHHEAEFGYRTRGPDFPPGKRFRPWLPPARQGRMPTRMSTPPASRKGEGTWARTGWPGALRQRAPRGASRSQRWRTRISAPSCTRNGRGAGDLPQEGGPRDTLPAG